MRLPLWNCGERQAPPLSSPFTEGMNKWIQATLRLIHYSFALPNMFDGSVIASWNRLFLQSRKCDIPKRHRSRTRRLEQNAGETAGGFLSCFPLASRPEMVQQIGHREDFVKLCLNLEWETFVSSL